MIPDPVIEQHSGVFVVRDHTHLGRHAGQRLQPDVYADADERADPAVRYSGASEGAVTAHKSIVGYTTRVICHEWTQKY